MSLIFSFLLLQMTCEGLPFSTPTDVCNGTQKLRASSILLLTSTVETPFPVPACPGERNGLWRRVSPAPKTGSRTHLELTAHHRAGPAAAVGTRGGAERRLRRAHSRARARQRLAQPRRFLPAAILVAAPGLAAPLPLLLLEERRARPAVPGPAVPSGPPPLRPPSCPNGTA